MLRKVCLILAFALGLLLVVGCQQGGQVTATPPRGATAAPAAATATKAAATAAPAPSVKRGGTLRFGQLASPRDFDPTTTALSGESRVWLAIYDTLLKVDADLKLAPELAESWEISPDGKVITFKLRKGVKFHDGTDFNAEAVKFILDRHAAHPKKGIAAGRLVTPYDSSQVVDDSTVRVNLKQPWVPFLYELTEHAGAIPSPTAVRQMGDDYTRRPVGTGPFKFVDFVADTRTTVSKFDGYWKKGADGQALPYLDGVVFRPIPDDNVRLINLRTGELDEIEEIPPKDIASVKGSKDLGFVDVASTGHRRLALLNDKPPFDNKALRQAVAYAIDKKGLIKAVEHDTGVVAETLMSPSFGLYDPNIKSLQYDPAKAKEKLKEGGKPDGFSFTAVTPNMPVYVQQAEVIQAQLAQVGITMKIEVLELGTVITRFTNAEFEGLFLFYGGAADPTTVAAQLIPPRMKMGSNVHWDNPRFVDLYVEQAAAYDAVKRKAIWSEMMKIFADEVPQIYLTHPSKNIGIRPQVKNVRSLTQVMFRFEDVWLDK